jgi:hypothetical protein
MAQSKPWPAPEWELLGCPWGGEIEEDLHVIEEQLDDLLSESK